MMATNQTKSRAPDLSPTPEEPLDPPETDDKSRPGAFSRSRSALNLHLQERLLSCGNFGALLDDEDRLGRRPSVGSLSVDESNRDRDSDDGGYFNLKRSPSQKSLLGGRRGSVTQHKRSYIVGVAGEESAEKSTLLETFNNYIRRSHLPSQKFIELNSDIIQGGRLSWPSNHPSPDAMIICKDISTAAPASRDTVGPLIDAFKSLSCPVFVLLLRSSLPTPISTPSTVVPNLIDPLNDPLISRAFSQQTKIRFLRVGPSQDDVHRTLKEILTILDQEIPQISPTRTRGLSSPAPYSRNNSIAGPLTATVPNLARRGSEATSRQTQSFSSQNPTNTSPVLPQILFQKARPFQLVLGRERPGGHSPPQSPKTLRAPSTLDPGSSDPVSQDYLSSRFPFAIPTIFGAKPVEPTSPAGTGPSLPGSRRQSRLLDSESDLASSDIVGEPEEWMERWPTDYSEEFDQALERLNLTGDGVGQTWNELIDRLVSPGIPGDDEDFIFIFLVFYRKFAAPSRLLHSLIAKFEEASNSAVDYMLQMIAQTRCCDVFKNWILTHPHDFCYPSTHTEARAFIVSLDNVFMLAHYSYELLPVIDAIEPIPENDIDRFWGRTDDRPDESREEDDFEVKQGTQSAPLSPLGGTPLRKRSLARWDSSRKLSIKEDQKEAPGRLQREINALFARGNSGSLNPSEPPSPDFSRTASQSTVATTVATNVDLKEIPHRLELVRSQSDVPHTWVDSDGAKRYEPFVFGSRERKESSASSISGSSVRENIKRMSAFWDSTPEELARSLTNLEWEYFTALRARDIPRHMWTPEDKRDKDSPMERIVHYFNHVAKWVAWTILYASKLKDRVRDLEKMLRVVIELRKLDNYDTLFAVISGLQNQSVHRLAKTFEEVQKLELEPVDDRKRSQGNVRTGKQGTLWKNYQSCCALMARDRNFSPYRMAFKNSFQSRIPWLSRHKADMMSAAAVNKTYVSDGLIKWSGFQVIGESLLSVLHCQNYPYDLGPRDEQLERAILDTPDASEQELDAKSHELEPPGKRSYSKSHSAGSQWISKKFSRW